MLLKILENIDDKEVIKHFSIENIKNFAINLIEISSRVYDVKDSLNEYLFYQTTKYQIYLMLRNISMMVFYSTIYLKILPSKIVLYYFKQKAINYVYHYITRRGMYLDMSPEEINQICEIALKYYLKNHTALTILFEGIFY